MSDAPKAPYPPDPDDDAAPVTELGDLVDAVVAGTDWANARARGAALRRVALRTCRLTGVELGESTLADVTFDDCRVDLAGMRLARLERVVFRDCRMAECDLYSASLTDVLFERCDLRGATIAGARLTRVELRGCELEGLNGAEMLRGVRMPWDDVVGNGPVFAAALGVEVVE